MPTHHPELDKLKPSISEITQKLTSIKMSRELADEKKRNIRNISSSLFASIVLSIIPIGFIITGAVHYKSPELITATIVFYVLLLLLKVYTTSDSSKIKKIKESYSNSWGRFVYSYEDDNYRIFTVIGNGNPGFLTNKERIELNGNSNDWGKLSVPEANKAFFLYSGPSTGIIGVEPMPEVFHVNLETGDIDDTFSTDDYVKRTIGLFFKMKISDLHRIRQLTIAQRENPVFLREDPVTDETKRIEHEMMKKKQEKEDQDRKLRSVL